MKDIQILPSVLSFDFTHIEDELKKMKKHDLTILHYDVMDGHFVPDISFGESLYKQLVPQGFKANVHLMIEDPFPHVIKFYQMCAECVLVHFESFKGHQLKSFIKDINKYRIGGRKLGLAINPETDLNDVHDYIGNFDIVMLMTVHPGRSGQSFLDGSLERISALRKYIDDNGLKDKVLIEVDGGLNNETGPSVVKAGADILVSGSYLCQAKDIEAAKKSLIGI